jgi:REP-associated tyrosine transposase
MLANPEIHETFGRFARKATERRAFVGRYVIMPDHMHLFAALLPEAPRLSGWMKGLKRVLG